MPQLDKFLEFIALFIFLLLALSIAFLTITTLRNHLILKEVIAWNKALGWGMRFEFGWGGVRLTPIPPEPPKNTPTSTGEKPKVGGK